MAVLGAEGTERGVGHSFGKGEKERRTHKKGEKGYHAKIRGGVKKNRVRFRPNSGGNLKRGKKGLLREKNSFMWYKPRTGNLTKKNDRSLHQKARGANSVAKEQKR